MIKFKRNDTKYGFDPFLNESSAKKQYKFKIIKIFLNLLFRTPQSPSEILRDEASTPGRGSGARKGPV